MLTTMDESGDPGVRFVKGESEWFEITAVVFPSREAADACRQVLTDLRREARVDEFHFTDNDHRLRLRVLRGLAACSFTYYTVARRKARLRPGYLRYVRKPADLRRRLTEHLFGDVVPPLSRCTVWFDTLGGAKPDQEYSKVLRRAAGKPPPGGKPRLHDCGPRAAASELLLAVPDYVCGSVAAAIRTAEPNPVYRGVIACREGCVVFWPPPVATDRREPPETEDGPPERPVPG